MITAVKENTKLKPALAIPTGVPITLAKEATDAPLLSADKTIKILSKAALYLLGIFLIDSLSRIFVVKWSLILLILFNLSKV